MTQPADTDQEIVTVELGELTLRRAGLLGLDLSELANELLASEVNRQARERAQCSSKCET